MAIDRAFSSWRHGTPGDKAAVGDYTRMESSIIAVLRRVAGYTDPNKDDGTFDPNKISTAYLSSVDTNTKNKMIADMAGLLWYRGLPLSKLARKELAGDSQADKNVSVCSGRSESTEKLLEHLDHVRDRLDSATDQLLKRDAQIIELQSEISTLKDSIIGMKDAMLESSVSAVKTVVKEEMQSYSSVLQTAATAVKETCVSALAPNRIRTAISRAAEDRSTNLIVYGLGETTTTTDKDKVKGLFETLSEAPVLVSVERLGKGRGEGVRPIRVVLRTREVARTILGKSVQLKDSEVYQRVFIAPDRTFEERAERRELVSKLKERKELEPEKAWRIRGNSVVETEKV